MAEIFGYEREQWAWVIGLVFMAIAVLLSITNMALHIAHDNDRKLRRTILVVLAMVPVYAICAWLGLVYKFYTEYFDLIRQCYEAIALAAFFLFLSTYCGGHNRLNIVLSTKPQQQHFFPFTYIPIWPMHTSLFLINTTFCVIQFVPTQLLMAILQISLESSGYYTEGNYNLNNGYIYIIFITNISQIVALYGLVLFYQSLHTELKPVRPLWKFLVLKSVVFFTWWQSLIVSGCASAGYVNATDTYTTTQESEGLQDFIICIEMSIAAIAHAYAFPYNEFENWTSPCCEQKMNEKKLAMNENKSDKINTLQQQQDADSGIELMKSRTPLSPAVVLVAPSVHSSTTTADVSSPILVTAPNDSLSSGRRPIYTDDVDPNNILRVSVLNSSATDVNDLLLNVHTVSNSPRAISSTTTSTFSHNHINIISAQVKSLKIIIIIM